jgi:hypothetical protein
MIQVLKWCLKFSARTLLVVLLDDCPLSVLSLKPTEIFPFRLHKNNLPMIRAQCGRDVRCIQNNHMDRLVVVCWLMLHMQNLFILGTSNLQCCRRHVSESKLAAAWTRKVSAWMYYAAQPQSSKLLWRQSAERLQHLSSERFSSWHYPCSRKQNLVC